MSKDQDPQNFPVSRNQDVESLTRGAENSEEVRVLVVDDEALIRWAMAATLKDAGYEVVEASSGQEAMASLHGHPNPHVIFLDYRLAGWQDLTLLGGTSGCRSRLSGHYDDGLRDSGDG